MVKQKSLWKNMQAFRFSSRIYLFESSLSANRKTPLCCYDNMRVHLLIMLAVTERARMFVEELQAGDARRRLL
jgi:hypothetical protein